MTVRLTPITAAAFYVVASLAMTWPLVLDLAHSLPGDLGDPLLNCYILAWGEKHFTAMLGGNLSAFAQWWQATIFYPARYALAYSEHLFAEVVMGWPVWMATGNVILTYNLVFLGSYALSGLGAFLLVRELTGRPRAALVAGLCFAFVPYRISQTPHVQVLSSEWMPFTLYALRRYFEHGRLRALAGAVAAMVAQQLSCGYYLIYFTPFVGVYVLWEVTARKRWTDRRLIGSLIAAGALVLALVTPFIVPYLQLRQLGFPRRSLSDVVGYSADVWGYFTTNTENRLWGSWLQPYPHSENDAFPGAILLASALAGGIAHVWTRWRATTDFADAGSWRSGPTIVAGVMFVSGLAGLLLVVATTGVSIARRPLGVNVRDATWFASLAGGGLAASWLMSNRVRAMLAISSDLQVWAWLTVVTAFVLSLGPEPHSGGRILSLSGPYLWLYEFVPGFDGLRVPGRLAMIVYVGLTVLAGYGLALLDRRRRGKYWMTALAVLVAIETTAVPFPLNTTFADEGLAKPPGRVRPAAEAPPIYRFLATLPPEAVIAELPFGYPSWELRYVYYSSVHWRHLLNGYSGGAPRTYYENLVLVSPLGRPQVAWNCLVRNGVTHVILHRAAYLGGEAAPLADWLVSHGARRLATFRDEDVFELPR